MFMVFRENTRTKLLNGFVFLAGIAALYHLVGVFYPVNDAPKWRHLLFVLVNVFCVYGFIQRPGYFLIIFAALLVQQFYSHGTGLIKTWTETGQIHWISVCVLVLLPIAMLCLLYDYKAKKNL